MSSRTQHVTARPRYQQHCATPHAVALPASILCQLLCMCPALRYCSCELQLSQL